MIKTTLSDRLRYRFDNFMAKGAIALIFGLGVIALFIIGFAALVITFGQIRQDETDQSSFAEAAWESLMRTLDAGTMGGDTGVAFRAVMLMVTFGGIFIVSALIGIINNGLEAKLGELRKGRSRVIENNHSVILGWSEQVFPIISELIEANESQRRPCVVILGEKDKVEMEDAIRERIPNTKNTRVICRSGSSIDPGDLTMVSVQTSRSIIVVAPDGDEEPDSSVIKTILAITNSPDRREEPYHIVSEIRDAKNLEAARMVGKDEVELVLISDLISRITVQTCRQSGLSVVYTELLDFGGDEIYFTSQPALTGKTFADVLFAFEDSAVMGIRPANQGPRLNPPMDTIIQPGDKLIVIAEDDSKIRLAYRDDYQIDGALIRPPQPVWEAPERTLILGWNWRVPSLINEMDQYVVAGSEVTVVAERSDGETQLATECAGARKLRFRFQLGDTTDRSTLDGLNLSAYHHIILVCSDELEVQKADARALIALLHVRDIVDRSGRHVSIVSEMLDIRNRNLAEVTRADDFIVSGKLISLMLSQISENKELNLVFQDLFDPEGSEIYLKPITNYVAPGHPINFYTLLAAAWGRGEVAIGYRCIAQRTDPSAGYGVKLNPKKTDRVTFAEGDKLIVLAES